MEEPGWKLIDIGLKTNARLFVAPLQDLLSLDDVARFNKPGTNKDNWNWRLNSLDSDLFKVLNDYGKRGSLWGRSAEGITTLFD